MKNPNFIVIHHTAVSRFKNKDQFIANNRYHQAQWQFKSSLGYYLGYNYEISAKGKIRKAREEGEETAAVYQNNMNDGRAIHIALDGNFDIEKPTPNQIYALRDLIKKIIEKYPIKDIFFHRDFAPKSCPGQNMDLNFIKKIAGLTEMLENDKDDLKSKIKIILEGLINLVKQL